MPGQSTGPSGLCAYRNTLGAPGAGLHRYRVFGMAAVDLVLTLLMALVLWELYHRYWQGGKRTALSLVVIIVGLFVIGEFAHWLFCVNTAVLRFLKLTK